MPCSPTDSPVAKDVRLEAVVEGNVAFKVLTYSSSLTKFLFEPYSSIAFLPKPSTKTKHSLEAGFSLNEKKLLTPDSPSVENID